MRMRLAVFGAVAAVAIAVGVLSQARAKEAGPQTMTITGQVVDLACYMRDPLHGVAAGHASCAMACANAGLPRGIMDSKTNQVYLSLGKNMMGPTGMDVKDYMNKKVEVTGRVFKRNGIQAIEVATIKDAK